MAGFFALGLAAVFFAVAFFPDVGFFAGRFFAAIALLLLAGFVPAFFFVAIADASCLTGPDGLAQAVA
jgi:hypothetical protein